MPRAWEVIVEPYPEMDAERDYLVSVLAIKKSKAPRGISVVLEHVDGEQVGRKHSIILPLPIRPDGITGDFFRACGMAVAVGGRLTPRDAIGVAVNARFIHADPEEDCRVVAFSPAVKKETINEQQDSEPKQHESAVSAAPDSA